MFLGSGAVAVVVSVSATLVAIGFVLRLKVNFIVVEFSALVVNEVVGPGAGASVVKDVVSGGMYGVRLDVVLEVPCGVFVDVVSCRESVVGTVESMLWVVGAGAVDSPEHVMAYPL